MPFCEKLIKSRFISFFSFTFFVLKRLVDNDRNIDSILQYYIFNFNVSDQVFLKLYFEINWFLYLKTENICIYQSKCFFSFVKEPCKRPKWQWRKLKLYQMVWNRIFIYSAENLSPEFISHSLIMNFSGEALNSILFTCSKYKHEVKTEEGVGLTNHLVALLLFCFFHFYHFIRVLLSSVFFYCFVSI